MVSSTVQQSYTHLTFLSIVEYTDMAKHATSVVKANGVEDVVTVIKGAVEEVVLPVEDGEEPVVDIIISEWMGYFLLRESMLDSLIRARDKFLKKDTGLMFPSHCNMYFAPVMDEEERKLSAQEYASAMSDWHEFEETTKSVYGVDMKVLEQDFDREQKEYYLLSSRWSELGPEAVYAEPAMVKHLDMCTCTIEDSRGIVAGAPGSTFDFEINGDELPGPVSGFAGWFTSDFKSRTDDVGRDTAPKLPHPAFLSTGPENGYTHWGQQVFHLMSSIPILKGQITRIQGSLEMSRTKENARLYNCRITYNTSRRNIDEPVDGQYLMKSADTEAVYQIP